MDRDLVPVALCTKSSLVYLGLQNAPSFISTYAWHGASVELQIQDQAKGRREGQDDRNTTAKSIHAHTFHHTHQGLYLIAEPHGG